MGLAMKQAVMQVSPADAVEEWTYVCALGEIPAQGARVVQAGEVRIALFRTAQDEIYAVEDKCPHRGGPLSQGIVFDKRVTCPLHGWTIQLDTGHACAPDEGCAVRYRIQVDQARVYLALND